jgi:hypothetical protein
LGWLSNQTNTFTTLSCPAGYTMQGLAYKDNPGTPTYYSDFADGVTPYCVPAADPAGQGMLVSNSDLLNNSRTYTTFACPAGSKPVGVKYKDTPIEWGASDIVDGVMLVCQQERCPIPAVQ